MQENNSLRIVIDTNLWISYLFGGIVELKIDLILNSPQYVILFSPELWEELIEVTERPKIVKYIEPEKISFMLSLLNLRSEPVIIHSVVDVCKDENDNFLFALCKDGKADYLLTGDRLVLEIEAFEGTKIISIHDFIQDWDGE